jgi:hypothetical protein
MPLLSRAGSCYVPSAALLTLLPAWSRYMPKGLQNCVTLFEWIFCGSCLIIEMLEAANASFQSERVSQGLLDGIFLAAKLDNNDASSYDQIVRYNK